MYLECLKYVFFGYSGAMVVEAAMSLHSDIWKAGVVFKVS